MNALRKVAAGEPISAEWANAIVDAIGRLARLTGVAPIRVSSDDAGTTVSLSNQPRLDLIELQDTLQSGDIDKESRRFAFDPSATDHWIDADDLLQHTADPQQGLYLAGERHLAFFHPAAGQRIPLPGVQFHIGKLQEELDAGGSAVVNVWRIDSGTASDSIFTVTAYDWMMPDGASLPAGQTVSLFQHPQSKRWFVFAQMMAPAYGGYGMNASPQQLTGTGLQPLAWDFAFGDGGFLATRGLTYDDAKQTITVDADGVYLAICTLHLTPAWTSPGPSSPTGTIQFDVETANVYLNGGADYVWDTGTVGYRWEVVPDSLAPVSGGYAAIQYLNPITSLPSADLALSAVFNLDAGDEISVQVNLQSYSGKAVNFANGQLSVARVG